MRAASRWTVDEREGDQHHHPEQVVAVLRARCRVSRDAAGVVAGVGGDQPRAEETEEDEDAALWRGYAAGRDGRGGGLRRAGEALVLGPSVQFSLAGIVTRPRPACRSAAAIPSAARLRARRRSSPGRSSDRCRRSRGSRSGCSRRRARDLLEVGGGCEPDYRRVEPGDAVLGACAQEVGDRDCPDELAARVHHEERGSEVGRHDHCGAGARALPRRSPGGTPTRSPLSSVRPPSPGRNRAARAPWCAAAGQELEDSFTLPSSSSASTSAASSGAILASVSAMSTSGRSPGTRPGAARRVPRKRPPRARGLLARPP